MFDCTVGSFLDFLNLQGNIFFFFTQAYIIFLLPVETKGFFLKCPCGWLLFWSSSPEKTRLAVGRKKHKDCLESGGFKHVDRWQPNGFSMHRKKEGGGI